MKKIATLAAAAVMLAVPATAFGKTISQTGFIKGDKAATIKLRVKVDGKDPQKVGGFKAKNVLARCDNGPIRISLHRAHSGQGEQRQRVQGPPQRRQRRDPPDQRHVKDNGKRTVGNLKTNHFESGTRRPARSPKQKFKTSA